jgi:hypothetical protein
MIIGIMKINFFISTNYPPAVRELNNGVDGRPFKLNKDIFIVRLIQINFSTPYGHAYLMIEVRFKIGDSWYIARALLNLNAERNFIL